MKQEAWVIKKLNKDAAGGVEYWGGISGWTVNLQKAVYYFTAANAEKKGPRGTGPNGTGEGKLQRVILTTTLEEAK